MTKSCVKTADDLASVKPGKGLDNDVLVLHPYSWSIYLAGHEVPKGSDHNHHNTAGVVSSSQRAEHVSASSPIRRLLTHLLPALV